MRTKNFFKGLAVAAVALVGAFATSCSEENLNVTATGSEVELPAAKATAIITVVDMGDMGIAPVTLQTITMDITDCIGQNKTFDCPQIEGYTVAASQTITIPSLEKGQTFSCPVTFYVAKFSSLFADVDCWTIDWGWDEGWNPFVEEGKTISGLEDEAYKNESNYWMDMSYEYTVKWGYSGVIENATARAAATTEEDVIDAFVQNMIATDETKEEYTETSTVCVYSWGYAEFKLENYYSKPTFEITYGETTKTVTLRNEMGSMCYANAYAIPGHEHAYNHSHTHGDYENAGGGGADAQ